MNDNISTRRHFLEATIAGAAAVGMTESLLAQDRAVARRNPLKITAVESFHLKHQLPKAIGPSTAYYRMRESLLVKITTDAGLVGWGETATLTGVRATIEELGLSDCVRYVGYVPVADLPCFYNLADCVVYPSCYEGFGLPVVEAMASGAPTITALSSSLLEVGGEGALFFDPTDDVRLSELLADVLDPTTGAAERVVRAGLEQARRFDWGTTARITVQLYEAVAAGATPAGAV